jgi:hypothetical protein
MAGKGKKSGKPGTGKGSHPNPYESRIRKAVDGMAQDVGYIVAWLDVNDPNEAPSIGTNDRITALTDEFDNGSQDQNTHDTNIENILYAIAGIIDQFKIHGYVPKTPATPPTYHTHDGRVVQLFITVNSECRDVFRLLDPITPLPAQPGPGHYDTEAICNLAEDTQTVVRMIWNYLQKYHPTPQRIMSK